MIFQINRMVIKDDTKIDFMQKNYEVPEPYILEW